MTGRDSESLRGAVLAVLAAVTLVACQTTITTSDGRPPAARPHRPPVTPAGAQANAMAMWVGAKGIDTNGNGYPDRISVEVYLFAQPHPMPMREPGEFVFTLTPIGALEPMAIWRFDREIVDRSWLFSPLYGEGYAFRLSLLETGTDVRRLTAVNLQCRFEPADGREAVTSDGVHSVQIGKR